MRDMLSVSQIAAAASRVTWKLNRSDLEFGIAKIIALDTDPASPAAVAYAFEPVPAISDFDLACKPKRIRLVPFIWTKQIVLCKFPANSTGVSKKMITARAKLDAISQTAASTWLSEIERIEKLAPEWFERWNELDPAIAPRKDVQQLIATAPNDWARGMVTGFDMFRAQVGLATGAGYLQQA